MEAVTLLKSALAALGAEFSRGGTAGLADQRHQMLVRYFDEPALHPGKGTPMHVNRNIIRFTGLWIFEDVSRGY